MLPPMNALGEYDSGSKQRVINQDELSEEYWTKTGRCAENFILTQKEGHTNYLCVKKDIVSRRTRYWTYSICPRSLDFISTIATKINGDMHVYCIRKDILYKETKNSYFAWGVHAMCEEGFVDTEIEYKNDYKHMTCVKKESLYAKNYYWALGDCTTGFKKVEPEEIKYMNLKYEVDFSNWVYYDTQGHSVCIKEREK